MEKQTVSATLDRQILKRLDAVAESSERKRSWLINKAIESYLEELEDVQIAKERLHEQRLSPKALRKEIGVPD